MSLPPAYSVDAASGLVFVSDQDSTANFLGSKLSAGTNISFNVLNQGGDEVIEIIASGFVDSNLVIVSPDDTNAGDLEAKLTAGNSLAFSTLNPGANESLNVAVDLAGADTQMLYNNAGIIGSAALFTFDNATGSVGIGVTPTANSRIFVTAETGSRAATFRVVTNTQDILNLQGSGATVHSMRGDGEAFFAGPVIIGDSGVPNVQVGGLEVSDQFFGGDGGEIFLSNSQAALSPNERIGLTGFHKANTDGPGAGMTGGLAMFAAAVINNGTYLTLSTANASTLDVERMRIDENGLVAIVGSATAVDFNGVALTTAGLATDFLNAQGNYVPAAAGGQVNAVVSGTNITIDATDPINPIVNLDADISLTTIEASGSSSGPASAIRVASAQPSFGLSETDAGVDGKNWDISASAGFLNFRTVNDANNMSVNFILVARTGTTVDQIALSSTLVTMSGAVTAVDFNGVALTDGGAGNNFLNDAGVYAVPVIGGVVDSVSGGTNINVTGTAQDPVVNLDANITVASGGSLKLDDSVQLNLGTDTDGFLRHTGSELRLQSNLGDLVFDINNTLASNGIFVDFDTSFGGSPGFNIRDSSSAFATRFHVSADSAQIGVGTSSPATSAALDITSITGALLLPRMTDTQRDALTQLAGMVVYSTTQNEVQFHNGTEWRQFSNVVAP